MSTAEMAKERDTSSRARRRTKEKDEDNKVERDQFHNYKPPLRLLVLELTIIILLIILLLIKPSGFSAISQSGNDRVGLLSSCNGSSCTSWLGAPAGGKTSASAATKRQLDTGTEAAGAEAPATDSTSSSSSTTSSSPTSFHLQTGLAAFCSLVLVSYAFIIHLIRLREKPPPAGTESDIESEKRKKSRFRKCCTPFANFDFNGVKRGGYRISRLFTVVNVLLLLCVCIAAGVQASSAGFAPGFVLLVFSWIMLLLVALMEFLDERRKVSTWLMFYRGRLRCGGDRRSSTKNEDVEKGSEMKQMERDRPLTSPKATYKGDGRRR